MSTKLTTQRNIASSSLGYTPSGWGGSTPITVTPWVRPADWITLPTVLITDEKFVGLHAVYPDANFLSLSAAGNYTVDWGDGTAVENIATGVQANHIYDYNAAFFNTNNAGGSSLTSGGYKQAVVTITPQAAQNLTGLNLHLKHPQTGLAVYSSGFLDIALSGPLMTSLLIGTSAIGVGSQTIVFRDLAKVNILSTAVSSLSYMFYLCYSLASVSFGQTSSVSNFSYMFRWCTNLQTVPLFNTVNATSMTWMFQECYELLEVPLFDTTNVTNFSYMFRGCANLQTVPLFNTVNATSMTWMFSGCLSLREIPLFNTTNVTNFSYTFQQCRSLKTVPLLNTSKATDMSSMFSGCLSLREIPLFNTGLVTNWNNTFYQCSSLQTLPLLNTVSATTFIGTFYQCSSLQTLPLLNTVSATSFASAFQQCYSLKEVPQFNTTNVTSFASAFQQCYSLKEVPQFNTTNVTSFTNAFYQCYSQYKSEVTGIRYAVSFDNNKLSQTALQQIIDNLGTANTQGLVLTITNNWGSVTPISLSGGTTVGSLTVTMASTTGITTGMQVNGIGTPATTAIAVTFTDVGDLVNLTAHGLSNTDQVSFATIVTTTGIVINKIYFVVGATANSFQVSLTSGGAAINLVTNGSGTLRYSATVTAINPNVSVTLSRKATSTGTNTLAFRNLLTNTALLKGWAVTG